MSKEKYIKLSEILKEQEKTLRFDRFTNRDAWALGSFLVQQAFDSDTEIAISIRKLNGNVIFQYFTEGTNLNNQNWMDRKFNSVSLNECSSLSVWADSVIRESTPEDQGLDSKEYAFCGGGFPICLKNGEMVAVLIVSNLPHLEDHQFVIDGLQNWLKTEVPQIDRSAFE